MKNTQNIAECVSKIKAAIDCADAVIVGAGAGLSSAAGFTYSGRRFHEHFHDFEVKYNIHDMYAGGFYPFSSPEEYWAYWSRYIFINRYRNPPVPLYDELYGLIRDKNYFVITTNVDHCFQKAGFDKQRLFYTQGDYGLLQCSVPCHNKTYDNEDLIRRMVSEQKDMKIPTELLPFCPVCGKPMSVNLRSDDTFVQDKGWHSACKRYESFIERHRNGRIVYLELGVGSSTPVIIKYPFWKMTDNNPKATYICINRGEAFCPTFIEGQSVCVNEDIRLILNKIA